MSSGIDRIKRVLQPEPEAEQVRELRSPALRILFCGLALCRGASFLLVHLASGALGAPTLLTSIFLGVIFSVILVGLGRNLFLRSGESVETDLEKFMVKGSSGPEGPLARVVRDFYRGFAVLKTGPSSQRPTIAGAASVMVAHLLDHGMSSGSQLQEALAARGYSDDWFSTGLSFLEDSGFVTVRANGVSIVATKRRYFL